MDRLLDGLMEFASARGSHYVKGDVAMWEIRRKTAEFGVLLLQFARQMTELDDEDLKSKLMEMQPYVDDFRKVVFCLKFKKAC